MKSRKLAIFYVIFIVATLAAFVPPLLVWLLSMHGKTIPQFSLLGSTEWVSTISLLVTTYFGSNVWEKHVALSNGIMPSQIDEIGQSNQVLATTDVAVSTSIVDTDKEAFKDAMKHGQ